MSEQNTQQQRNPEPIDPRAFYALTGEQLLNIKYILDWDMPRKVNNACSHIEEVLSGATKLTLKDNGTSLTVAPTP